MSDEGFIRFPLWIERSGLPARLAEECKTPLAWMIFRKVVELDCARNRTPGVVEVSLRDLAELTAIDAKKLEATIRKMRKCAVLRSFLPDNEEEEALFEVIAPLATPIPWEEVRKAVPELFHLSDRQFRYAHAREDAPPPSPDGTDPKLKEVVDLYLDNVSMKMNAFILDELRLIASRFDLPLVRKVFARARTREVQSLAWILREIRIETKAKRKSEPGA